MDSRPNINKIPSKNIRTILRLFPYLKDKNLASKLLIDDESFHYISIREYAEKISDIITHHLTYFNISKNNGIICDATAGVGGDTISFAKNFHYIYAIEMDKDRAFYLQNNIQVYELLNVNIINDDCLKVLNKINNHNVIFIDPPWQNSFNDSYKKYKNLRLTLSDLPIESFCNKLMDESFMKKIPELIVLKLPKNYDIENFFNCIKKPIYYYDLNKMIIIVIIVKTR